MAYALRSRLNPTVRDVFRRCQLLTRYTSIVDSQCRCFAARDNVDEDEPAPTKFTTSKAYSLSARSAREKTTTDDTPWAQTFSLTLSLVAFLIYFGCLREPNDLDAMIERDISDRVPDLQEAHDKLKTRAGRQASRSSLQ